MASLALTPAILLLIYLLVRFVVLRNPSRRQTLQLHDLEPPSRGLDPNIIASFPVFIIEEKTQEEADGVSVAEDCVVCLSGLEENEMAKMLPNCKHLFHVGCIDTWLASNMTCPLCRATVEPLLEPHLREGPSSSDNNGSLSLVV